MKAILRGGSDVAGSVVAVGGGYPQDGEFRGPPNSLLSFEWRVRPTDVVSPWKLQSQLTSSTTPALPSTVTR